MSSTTKDHGPVARLLGTASPIAVDVGARGDIPAPWRILGNVASFLAFEPDIEAADRLRSLYRRRGYAGIVLPIALSAEGGQRTLFVTNAPSGSSLLPPDTDIIVEYCETSYLLPVTEHSIETRRLADVLDDLGYDDVTLMKLDVQGAELEVLAGLGSARLSSVMALELEAGMHEIYRGQPTYSVIEPLLRDHGFELFDLRSSRVTLPYRGHAGAYQREVFGVQERSATISARIWDVDALFFRSPTLILNAGDEVRLRTLAVCLCVYGFFPDAHHLLGQAHTRGIMSESATESARQAVVDWHRTYRYKPYHGVNKTMSLIRTVARLLRIDSQVQWQQYQWRRYPDS